MNGYFIDISIDRKKLYFIMVMQKNYFFDIRENRIFLNLEMQGGIENVCCDFFGEWINFEIWY